MGNDRAPSWRLGRDYVGDICDHRLEHGRVRVAESGGYGRGPGIVGDELRGRGEAEHVRV
jgi:hypothetical protein